MKYIALPTNEIRQLSFYLAMEEYVARHVSEPDCFFMWQVEPSVIFGRNQVLENEVNLEYCRANNIRIYRRKSGGGCVYADMDNLMLSMVTDGDQVGFTFNRFVTLLQSVLHKMGIDVTSTTHNDIMIGDKKVCGTAFYQLPGRSIVHSTMLYDTNMQQLEKKGIQSVRQRITLLKDHTQLTLDDVKALIRNTLCDGELMLTSEQVAEIEKIEQGYLKSEFIHLIQ